MVAGLSERLTEKLVFCEPNTRLYPEYGPNSSLCIPRLILLTKAPLNVDADLVKICLPSKEPLFPLQDSLEVSVTVTLRRANRGAWNR